MNTNVFLWRTSRSYQRLVNFPPKETIPWPITFTFHEWQPSLLPKYCQRPLYSTYILLKFLPVKSSELKGLLSRLDPSASEHNAHKDLLNLLCFKGCNSLCWRNLTLSCREGCNKSPSIVEGVSDSQLSCHYFVRGRNPKQTCFFVTVACCFTSLWVALDSPVAGIATCSCHVLMK